MKTKTYDMKKLAKSRFIIGTIALVAGIILIFTNPDLKLGQIMIPNTLFTMGIILIIISFKNYYIIKEIKYDERDQLIALKSSNITLSVIIYASIIGMLIGTIQKVPIDLMTTSAIILFGTIIIHKLSHYYLNKKN
jgi:uncharacterized membrane protein